MEEILKERTEEKVEKPACSAMLVANYMVKQCVKMELPLTNQTLQPLLYLMQLCHLKLYGTRLFDDDIEKHRNGPIIPGVYRNFAQVGCIELKRTREEVVVTEIGESFQAKVVPYDKKRMTKKARHLVKRALKKFTNWTGYDLAVITTELPGWQRDRESILLGNRTITYTLSDMEKDLARLLIDSDLK